MTRPSDRQLEILCLTAKGMTRREIAAELFLSIKTVDRHYQLIAEKMESKNIVHSLMLSLQHGFLTMNEMTGDLYVATPVAAPAPALV